MNSRERFKKNKSVDRTMLEYFVGLRLKHSIRSQHIRNVISILIEELMVDLLSGVKIIIGNFGKFTLNKMLPRRHYDVTRKKFSISRGGGKIIRFFLDRKFRQILISNLDIPKTFSKKDE